MHKNKKQIIENGFIYEYSPDCTHIALIGFTGCYSGKGNIACSFDGVPVTSIRKEALTTCVYEELFIPSSIKFMGESCMSYNNFIKYITFENDNSCLEHLEYGVFKSCSNLEKIIFPNECKLERLPSEIFTDCVSLTTVSLPYNIKVFGHRAFAGCESLKSLDFKNVQELQRGCFVKTGLAELKLPSSLKQIQTYMFCKMNSLEKVLLPDSLEFLEEYSFDSNPNLKEIYISRGTLKGIDSCAFNLCSNSELIFFIEDNKPDSIGLDEGFFKGVSDEAKEVWGAGRDYVYEEFTFNHLDSSLILE